MLRGLEMLLGLLGGLLVMTFLSNGFNPWALVWAGAGVFSLLGMTNVIMRVLLPYTKEEGRWLKMASKVPGLEVLGRGGVHRPSLTGTLEQGHVHICPVNQEHLVTVSPALLEAESPVDIKLHARGRNDADGLALGDQVFDAQLFLQGNLPEAAAVFDADTRALAIEVANRWAVEVKGRKLQRYGRDLDHDQEGTRACLSAMLELGARLFKVAPSDIPARLERNAIEDPHPGVRALNLGLLLEYYPVDARALKLAKEALEDDDLRCVLKGAVGLAEFGDADQRDAALSVLLDIVRGETFADELRADALLAVYAHYPKSHASALSDALLRGAHGPLPSSTTKVTLRLGRPVDPKVLLTRVRTCPAEMLVRHAAALAELGSKYQPVLITMLDHGAETVVRAAISALERSGSVDAIPSLTRLSGAFWFKKGTRRRAKTAIGQIQARLGERDVGRLSLFSQSRQGRVSLGPQAAELSCLDQD